MFVTSLISRRRCTVVTGLAVAALGPAMANAAAPSRGVIYGGMTSADEPVVVQLSPDGKRVVRFTEMWEADCQGGGTFPFSGAIRANIKLSKTGGFSSSSTRGTTSGSGILYLLKETLKGTVNGRSASGSLSADLRLFDKSGNQINACKTKFTFKVRSAKNSVFGGVTSDDEPVVIQLAQGSKKVQHFNIGWSAICKPSGNLAQIATTRSNIKIARGKFSFRQTLTERDPSGGSETLTYTLSGTIKGTQASGKFRAFYSVKDVAGIKTGGCDSGTATWRAASG